MPDLDEARFASRVQIEADAGGLSCRRTRFPGGVRFAVRRAFIRLDDSDLSVPSLLTGRAFRPAETAGLAPGSINFTDLPNWSVRKLDKHLRESGTVTNPAEAPERPKLLSVQRANVAGLVVGDVHLVHCRFAGAHNLDQLRLESGAIFGLSRAVAGWERRQVIAEGSAWRACRAPGPAAGSPPALAWP